MYLILLIGNWLDGEKLWQFLLQKDLETKWCGVFQKHIDLLIHTFSVDMQTHSYADPHREVNAVSVDIVKYVDCFTAARWVVSLHFCISGVPQFIHQFIHSLHPDTWLQSWQMGQGEIDLDYDLFFLSN